MVPVWEGRLPRKPRDASGLTRLSASCEWPEGEPRDSEGTAWGTRGWRSGRLGVDPRGAVPPHRSGGYLRVRCGRSPRSGYGGMWWKSVHDND